MKYKAVSSLLAVLLAVLLAGCGAETAAPASAAAKPAGSKQTAALAAAPAEPDSMMEPETVPETAPETENAETPRITEQISLEKQCSAGYTTISVHLPKLESDSADAARINQELWEMGSEYIDLDPDAILAAGRYTWDAT